MHLQNIKNKRKCYKVEEYLYSEYLGATPLKYLQLFPIVLFFITPQKTTTTFLKLNFRVLCKPLRMVAESFTVLHLARLKIRGYVSSIEYYKRRVSLSNRRIRDPYVRWCERHTLLNYGQSCLLD